MLLNLFSNYSQNDLLRILAIEDESWIPFELIGHKEDNKVWIPPQAPRPVVVRPQLTFKKTMLTIAFYWKQEGECNCYRAWRNDRQ